MQSYANCISKQLESTSLTYTGALKVLYVDDMPCHIADGVHISMLQYVCGYLPAVHRHGLSRLESGAATRLQCHGYSSQPLSQSPQLSCQLSVRFQKLFAGSLPYHSGRLVLQLRGQVFPGSVRSWLAVLPCDL